jgi:cephalosporin-C deacetylase-like acetyl esterase
MRIIKRVYRRFNLLPVIIVGMCLGHSGSISAENRVPVTPVVKNIKKLWEAVSLKGPPGIYPADGIVAKGVKGIFFTGPPYKGRETRVFAWYNIPGSKGNKKVPAMVLVHGAEGTAIAQWVRLWNKRGYAAISLDTHGAFPVLNRRGQVIKKNPHDYSGPRPRRWGGFEYADENPRDQWMFHAVADIILAHSLIRSFPGVDKNHTGITGISWGGILACIAASVDPRFKCVIPVYGCGFLGENTSWAEELKQLKNPGQKWLEMWDPSRYLEDIKIPVLWIAGTNDPCFYLPSLQKSYRLIAPYSTLCIRVDMGHNIGEGLKPREIYAFTNNILKGKKPLPEILEQGKTKDRAWITFKSSYPVVKAEFNYTAASGSWKKRKWKTSAAEVDNSGNRATAGIPQGTTVYYFNIVDQRNLIVSSPCVVEELNPRRLATVDWQERLNKFRSKGNRQLIPSDGVLPEESGYPRCSDYR